MASEKEEKGGWKQFRENLKKSYRLVVMNNESFEEVGSYQLSLLNLYSAICAVLVGVVLLVFLLIFFTPIKRLIPCLLYTSPSPRDATLSRMPSSA